MARAWPVGNSSARMDINMRGERPVAEEGRRRLNASGAALHGTVGLRMARLGGDSKAHKAHMFQWLKAQQCSVTIEWHKVQSMGMGKRRCRAQMGYSLGTLAAGGRWHRCSCSVHGDPG
jgi:hypothetical protein